MRGKRSITATGVFAIAAFLFLFVGGAQAASKVIEFKFAHIFPPPAKHSKICEAFVKDLEKRTGGRIKTRYFGGGSLLKPPGMAKGLQMGIADMGFAHVEYSPGRFPVTEVCDLPLGYPSGWVSNHVVNDFYQKFKPKEWDKLKVLWMHASTPNVMITTKPIRKLEDLKGLTIRAPGRVGNTVSALGASPAPMPIMEVYDAIAKGVIHGVNTPFETLKTFRFAEVAKYTTSSWQVGNLYTFYVAMNKRSYEKIPPDLKEIFDELCGEYKEKFALMWNSVDFDGKDFAAQKGVQIIHLSPEEVARWKEVTKPVIEGYIKDMVGKGYSEKEVRGWISYLRERIDFWTKKQLDYRIKSPTGPDEMRP
ncbi:MAG: TRAP transporter substrate-binding protein [Deltaproteobacteria bacterium]|nr:TRAP transporter substrate-binding protein [Deltaproteobacteria bacterium]MBW2017543.1 TRAP transporter substrate-binding protein [Deltaproteobacteria bacterium]MBW2304082.1 TRAP transporter substrate-binding protein [Deltaproteobacteria bacterium]